MTIPREPAELTVEWFNAHCPGLPEMASVSIEHDVSQGMMSRVVRVVPVYAGDGVGGTPALMVKLASDNPAMRARPQSRLAAVKEVGFYRELAARAEMAVPACFCAEADDDSGAFVLVLEAVPGTTRDPESGCSAREAERAVTALARLHGSWWDKPALESIAFLPEPEIPEGAETEARHRRWWSEFQEIVGEELPPEMRTFGDRLGARFPGLVRRLALDGPRTLRHGDFSLSNLLFRDGDGSVVAIDWQMLALGKGVWDLAWFLGQSLTVEQRRDWEEDLLEVYLSVLRERGVTGYGADECLADYRTALAQRFGTLISSIVALPFTAEQKATIRRVQLPRNVAAILDHGGVALLEG